jgi:hypothetical protein
MSEHAKPKPLKKKLNWHGEWETEGLPIPWWYWTIRPEGVDKPSLNYNKTATLLNMVNMCTFR